jgi:hypothetical protein
MKLLKMNSTSTTYDAIEVIEGLKKDILDGNVVAFFAAAVGKEDDTYAYVGSTKFISQLRLIGAMAHALHMLHHDEV